MKIYNLIENLDDSYGGPAKSVPYMCKYLNGMGVESQLLSIKYTEKENNSIVREYDLNWETFKYNYFKTLRLSNSLRNYLSKELAVCSSEMILHSHNLWNYIPFLAYRQSIKHNTPLVVSIRGSVILDKIRKKMAWALFQKKILKNSRLIHVTNYDDISTLRNFGIKTPIAMIPNGINISEFNNTLSQNDSKLSLSLNVKKKYILFLSRLHPKKGLEYLVSAWLKIAKEKKDWDLLIVGPDYNNRYTNNILKNIENDNLSHRTHVKGMLVGQKRLNAFTASNLFVLPTHSENFGIAILEAMASKLPVITTHGSPWQEIEQRNAGWWVKLNQKNIDKSLYDALELKDYELKAKGLNGFDLVKKYDWEYQAVKMKIVYEYILNKTGKPDFLFEL